mmetsp:Transcript_38408/g.42481  ORF Transcript_38408/g.42481 Transcript_38408/m.42481 type:complete len:261 (-) Transcript_38408:61-843(-)|eukprot:CAMPEP_0194164994 /NCGR_PEP_ID=MMETSP0154-20130528/1033_1 /TAXON_ID=1049557 /ORGANISM="Thalassiothrix antarctica, Strain L6-D1" /LENGTH=260 /DNA_ID=CAMNT_0038875333 /DNA_START=29 /DNA_END=811 /DNA_ORIENTATION=+
MPKELNEQGANNVQRRTWDKATYEARAKARLEAEKAKSNTTKPNRKKGPVRDAEVGEKRLLGEEEAKEEFTPAASDAIGPENSERSYLKARRNKVEIDSKVGLSEVVSAEAAATSSTCTNVSDGVIKTGVGWHCKVCDCFLKDSHTYLDHINGRKHQRNLGYSMRTQRSTKEEVNDRLKQLVRKQEAEIKPIDILKPADVIRMKDEELQKRREERTKRRQEKKKGKKKQEEADDGNELQVDPALAAMMGFSGFGGGNKNC